MAGRNDRTDRKPIAKYAQVLAMQHQFITSILAEIIQLPSAENGGMAVFKCTVTIERDGQDPRVFVSHGDAAPDSVSPDMRPNIVRIAETRAKARAIKDAIGFTGLVAEEMSDYSGESASVTRTAVSGARLNTSDTKCPCGAAPGKPHATACTALKVSVAA